VGLQQRTGSRAYGTLAAQNLATVYARLGEAEQRDSLQDRIDAFARERASGTLASSAGRPVERFADSALVVEPNARDADGTEAFVYFAPEDMPVRVVIGAPEQPASDGSLDETRDAAIAGFRAWEQEAARLLPWFRIEIAEPGAEADVEVVWTRKARAQLPATGEIFYASEGGRVRARGRVTLSTQPFPNPKYRVALGELHAHAVHAFGSALGLSDCSRCDSVMSLDWMRRKEIRPTDLDLRRLEALVARPNGVRVDGRPLGATPAVAAPAAESGVLASLPFINVGREGPIVIDLAPTDEPSFVLQLDTGATDTVLTTDYARALGISVRSVKTDAHRRKTVVGDPLEFWVTGQSVVGGGRGPEQWDYGLLGGEFLKNYVVEIDFPRRRVRFLDRARRRVGDEPGEVVVELRTQENRPYAKLALGSGEVWALVDTGAEAPIALSEEKAAALGIAVDRGGERRGVMNVLGTQVEVVQKHPVARLGPVELRDVDLAIALGDESSVRIQRFVQGEALIGVDVLRSFRVRFDYGRRKMGLTPAAAGDEDVVPSS
jgi:predicted aspartyl protease